MAQRKMWANGVVVNPSAFCQHLHLLQRVEGLPVEELIAQLGGETLAVAIFRYRVSLHLWARGSFGRLLRVKLPLKTCSITLTVATFKPTLRTNHLATSAHP